MSRLRRTGHYRTTKTADVTFLAYSLNSWDKVLAEIEKCDVRCANCHRRRTAQQFDTLRHRTVLALRPVAAPPMAIILDHPVTDP